MSPNAVIAEQRLQRCQDSFMEVAFAFAQARFGLRPRVESLPATTSEEPVFHAPVPVGIVRSLLFLFIP